MKKILLKSKILAAILFFAVSYFGLNAQCSITPVGGNVMFYNPTTICLNSPTGNMTLANYTGQVVRWEKRLNGASWASIPNTANITTYSDTPSVSGTWEYRAVVGGGSCPEAFSSPMSFVITNLTITLVSTNSSACQNNFTSTISYTSTTGNASGVKIDFNSAANSAGIQDLDQRVTSGGGGGTLNIQYQSGTVPVGTYYGILTVVSDNPSCTSSTTYPVTITISSSTTPISISTQPSNSAICTGANTSFSVVTSGGSSYQWQVSTNGGTNYSNISNGGVYSNVTTSTMNITSATAVMNNYRYRCIVSGCSTPTTSNAGILTINGNASIASVTGAASICIGGIPSAYTANSVVLAGGTGSWSSTNTAVATVDASGNVTGVSSGTTDITYTITGGCSGTKSAFRSITINSLPAAAGTITGISTVSQGQSNVSYSVGTIANATSYFWSYSGVGATINGSTNTPTITFASNATSGNLTVRGVNTCGNGVFSANYPITVGPPCIATETPGDNIWKGYVYTYTGNNPAATTYEGSIAENPNFDRDITDGTITGNQSVEANNFCRTAPNDKFFVKYLMNVNITEAGDYSITVGGDDGYRLFIDDVLVPGINNWGTHGYTTSFVKRALSTGVHKFRLEYFENESLARVSFSYGLPKGDPTLPFGDNVWNVYGFSKANLDFNNTELRDSYAGYYIDPSVSFDSQNFWNKTQSPSVNNSAWNGIPIQINNFTLSYRRKGFACGRYQIQLVNCDDVAQVYIDGTSIFSQTYTTNGGLINNGAFYTLNKNSQVEIRLREDGGDANVAFKFIEVPFVYDGSVTPPVGSSITVNQDSNVSNNLEVCSCYISAGKTLTVPANVTFTVLEKIDVKANGKLVVKNDGSLLQDTNGTYIGAADSFIMERTSSAMKNFDYSYWSSPVAAQKLYDVSPNTLLDKFMSYTGTGWKVETPKTHNMIPGIGYIIRVPKPNFWPVPTATSYSQPVQFKGIPNNGNIPGQTVAAGNFYLIGNPYPSAIKASDFLAGNAVLNGTIYFWTHNTAIKKTGSKYIYVSDDYASHNGTGGVSATSGGIPPSGYIAAGQSFFGSALTSGTIQFKNSMRVAGNNSQFFKPAKTAKTSEISETNRLWLNMTNAEGAFKQTLIGYVTGATNDIDSAFDGESFDGNSFIDFYSVNNTDKLVIQGRALPFEETDTVPLGYRSTIAGDFTIAIDNADGLLAAHKVYIEDKQTNTVHELTANDYTFTTAKGTFDDRFVVKYSNKTLGTGEFETVNDGVEVIIRNRIITINSEKENINKVLIYDISGKQLYQKDKISNTAIAIDNLKSGQQIVLVRVILENGSITTKKVIFK